MRADWVLDSPAAVVALLVVRDTRLMAVMIRIKPASMTKTNTKPDSPKTAASALRLRASKLGLVRLMTSGYPFNIHHSPKQVPKGLEIGP